MALQVRLRHSLGERVLELPERGVSEPLIVGRGREADLQVPSISVAPQHCVLFVHDGQWVVQGMSGVVTLNGEPLSEPAALQIGDVVGLSQEPAAPTLEIDPIGAAEGCSGPVQAAPAAAPAPAVRRMAPAPADSAGRRPAAAPARAPAPAPSQGYGLPPQPVAYEPETPAEQLPAEGGGIESFDWASGASTSASTTSTTRRTRKPPQNSSGALVATIVIASVAIIVVIAYVVKTMNARQAPVVTVQPPPKVRVVVPKAKGLFDPDADQAAARAQAAGVSPSSPEQQPTPAVPSDTTPPAPAPAPATGTDPGSRATPKAADTPANMDAAEQSSAKSHAADDPDWAAVDSAHLDVRHQGLAVIRYDEYRRDHPGKFTADLDKYTDEAVNWLYWQRVAQLWKKQDELAAQIKQKELDLRNQPPGEFHDQLAKEQADLKQKLDESKKKLTDEMGYTSDIPPDAENPSQLQQLSQKRDPDKFGAFRKRVLSYVRNNHGGTWWDGE